MTGYLIEYWPGTDLVKMVLAFEGDTVPEGWGFIKEGDPIPDSSPAPLTAEQLSTAARAERDRLLTYAALRINPLQDAVDLGRATEEKKALLNKWKEYRVDLDDVVSQPGFPEAIAWPKEP